MGDWRKSLIPNVGPHHWMPSSPTETLNASDSDKSLRPIAVSFLLEDPRARTQHVYVTIEQAREFHHGTGDQTLKFWLEDNEQGLLRAITVGAFDQSTESAFKRASSSVYALLSLWSYQYVRPFSISEARLEDKKHGAIWTIPKFCAAAASLSGTSLTFSPTSDIGSLFALFREGMNSTSFAYRFLSYYKIAEAWKDKKGPFASLIAEALRKGKTPSFPSRIVTEDFLTGSYRPAYHACYLNKKFTWCVDNLEDIRAVLAHPFNKTSHFANLDSPDVQAHLGALANLIERIAIQILVDFLNSWDEIDDTGLARQVKSAYSHMKN